MEDIEPLLGYTCGVMGLKIKEIIDRLNFIVSEVVVLKDRIEKLEKK